jgi:hypothetical protein
VINGSHHAPRDEFGTNLINAHHAERDDYQRGSHRGFSRIHLGRALEAGPPCIPVVKPDPKNEREQDRVTGCQVIRRRDWFLMSYIGFQEEQSVSVHELTPIIPLMHRFGTYVKLLV